MTAKPSSVRPYQLFMLGLCVYVLVALALTTFFPVSNEAIAIIAYVDTAICLVFLADFLYCLFTAESKLRYMKWGWIDLLSSIPMVDALRWGRLARVLRIIRLLRGVRSIKTLGAFLMNRRAESAFMTAALLSILIVVFASIAILEFETGPQSNIRTGEDALWWAFVTMTTVGYGDTYPVTTGGRVIAAVLMAAGVGLFGTFTGFVASWFIAPGEKGQDAELQAIREDLAEIRDQLERNRT